jgi:hypothetical protein
LVPLRLVPEVLTGPPNQSPVIDAIGPVTVLSGHRVSAVVTVNDPDLDPVVIAVEGGPLPPGGLDGTTLYFTPTPADVGIYTFDVVASDGSEQARRTVSLTVVADPVTSTQLSGVVQNVVNQPLGGISVELGGTTVTTAADGSFQLAFAGPLPAGPLVVHGEQFAGPGAYPQAALDPAALLGREPATAADNVMDRPVLLMPIDTANPGTINPAVDSTVTTPAINGVSLRVPAGSTTYAGPLAITDIPNVFPPAPFPDGAARSGSSASSRAARRSP